ncbi:XAC2610-related protein [Leeuwenhoekiella aequorea]|uniref:Uncharacterized protein n=1 Tax=Leeuwenhoekiella aequorea TaxID=283736 RepID=A0A4Q0P2C5_9FLAO|nr:hypothetical protein [Leeuwenhoekiella aequorea]RXG20694.1 hypothetical protein DSM00_2798 [Leeuwenhoekiella aequorea]
MKTVFLIASLLFALQVNCQISYSGKIGKSPIKLVLHQYSDGNSRAFYAYDKYDSPINIDGYLDQGNLKLFEYDNLGAIAATLTFRNYNTSTKNLIGDWINADHSQHYKIFLKKDFSIDSGTDIQWFSREFIQPTTTANHYFKLVTKKEKNEFYARVKAVKIFQKRTDKLIQTLSLDCQLLGIDNLQVEDYNFDGLQDFSVFEASYAGANTSRIYILKDPNSETYSISNFSGMSLEFDPELKRIYEHNQCCAGTSIINSTYKVVDNAMVLLDTNCLQYDESTAEYIEVDCE